MSWYSDGIEHPSHFDLRGDELDEEVFEDTDICDDCPYYPDCDECAIKEERNG